MANLKSLSANQLDSRIFLFPFGSQHIYYTILSVFFRDCHGSSSIHLWIGANPLKNKLICSDLT